MKEQEKKKLSVLFDDNSNEESLIYKFLSKSYDINIVKVDDKFKENIRTYNIVNVYPDLIIFTGGEDVDPSLYGEAKGKYTYINEKRDSFCKNLYEYFSSTPKLGICRGSQFLTVMSGGKLVQHTNGHQQTHEIVTNNNRKFNVTSDHHQMMYPFNLLKKEFEILANSKYYQSTTYLNGDNEEIKLPIDFLECEVVFYNNTKSLCIQGHPEYLSAEENFINFSLNMIDKYLLNNKGIQYKGIKLNNIIPSTFTNPFTI